MKADEMPIFDSEAEATAFAWRETCRLLNECSQLKLSPFQLVLKLSELKILCGDTSKASPQGILYGRETPPNGPHFPNGTYTFEPKTELLAPQNIAKPDWQSISATRWEHKSGATITYHPEYNPAISYPFQWETAGARGWAETIDIAKAAVERNLSRRDIPAHWERIGNGGKYRHKTRNAEILYDDDNAGWHWQVVGHGIYVEKTLGEAIAAADAMLETLTKSAVVKCLDTYQPPKQQRHYLLSMEAQTHEYFSEKRTYQRSVDSHT